ncbi:MAG: cytochrome c [Microthrixaceae bacterium]
MKRPRTATSTNFRLAAGGIAAMVALLAGCGGGDQLSGEAASGEDLYRSLGCAQCHSTSPGVAIHGPSWAGLAGSEVTLADGTTVTADREYLERAITDPDADLTEGYGDRAIMPTVPVEPDQLDALVAYIESLGEPSNEG